MIVNWSGVGRVETRQGRVAAEYSYPELADALCAAQPGEHVVQYDWDNSAGEPCRRYTLERD